MKISFCLPYFNTHAQGGYKMVYEYANRLVKDGHTVTIYYHSVRNLVNLKIPIVLKRFLLNVKAQFHPKWFKLNHRVKKVVVMDISDREIKDADCIFATGFTTAAPVKALDESKGKKFYLIQDFENWEGTDKEVYDSYGLGMNNIVISKWLKEIVDEYSETEACYVPNAINTKVFRVVTPIESRDPLNIALLYHKSEHKGVKYALAALQIIKEQYPCLKVKMFGAAEFDPPIPEWIEYTQNADEQQLTDIYNSSAIFVAASVKEGFGLTGAESMACGCALAATQYQGVYEYAVDGKNALLSPIKDVDVLSKNIVRLIQDNQLRFRLAHQAAADMQFLSWEEAYEKFIDYVEKKLKE